MVTINNIKVEFHLDPPVLTFLQGCVMDIETIRDTIRQIEESEEGRMYGSWTQGTGLILGAAGNYSFGTEITAMDITILNPFVVKFEAGAIPFQTENGSLLGTFIESSGAIVQINNAKGALKVETGSALTKADVTEAVWEDIEGLIVRKMLYNKVVDEGNDVIAIYEDDGITVWKKFNVADLNRIEL